MSTNANVIPFRPNQCGGCRHFNAGAKQCGAPAFVLPADPQPLLPVFSGESSELCPAFTEIGLSPAMPSDLSPDAAESATPKTATTNLSESVEFADNPEPRCPCVLLLDTSGSMEGLALDALHEGLRAFKRALANDQLASLRVEVAVVTFDDTVTVVQEFVTADQFDPPVFTAGGHTCLASAFIRALDLIQARKEKYKVNGVTYFRPWVFAITDGEPDNESEDLIQKAADRVRLEEQNNRVVFVAVGVEGANMDRLSKMVVRKPEKLTKLDFESMFLWLSNSLSTVVQAGADIQIELPKPG